ncbi:SIS domain-containing protein [Martelella alba]|uniref:SIS domain-containing protein n=1 Tax=Martelella alba TaxID=2590451 RepID=A0ABY2SL66_9HYPH|nr:SIS domain-containing protein [Martelella alba]TKI06127.1 SIS domain-containing protein [Martelella alba]
MTNLFNQENALAIGAKIKMSLSLLNTTERGIAEWLITKGNVGRETSIRYVALSLNVSEPLIVKVAKKLGYTGFRELRQALWSYFLSLPFDKEQEIAEHDSIETVMDKIFNNAIHSLKEARSIADPAVINQASRWIYSARQVLIFGIGGSAAVGMDFEQKLLQIGIQGHTYNDYHLMLMAACQVSDQDVIIVISQSGDTPELLQGVEVAKNRGAKIICITNDNVSPLSQKADLSIFSPTRSGTLLEQNAVARIIQLNLLDTLFIATVLQDFHGATEKLERSIETVKSFQSK